MGPSKRYIRPELHLLIIFSASSVIRFNRTFVQSTRLLISDMYILKQVERAAVIIDVDRPFDSLTFGNNFFTGLNYFSRIVHVSLRGENNDLCNVFRHFAKRQSTGQFARNGRAIILGKERKKKQKVYVTRATFAIAGTNVSGATRTVR